jgi:hypothetical protein
VDRTCRVTLKLYRKDGPSAEASDKLAVAIFQQEAQDCDAVADQIARGQLLTLADALAVVRMKAGQLLTKFAISGFSLDDVPTQAAQP